MSISSRGVEQADLPPAAAAAAPCSSRPQRLREEVAESRQAAAGEAPRGILHRCAQAAREQLAQGGGAGAGEEGRPSWEVEGWLAGLEVAKAIADGLVGPIRQDPQFAQLQLPYIRSLGQEPRLKEVLFSVLQSTEVQEGLAERIASGVSQLHDAQMATVEELKSKFQSQQGTFDMSYASIDMFFSGLEGMIGSPSPKLREAMELEHCSSADSDDKWKTRNYGIETTPRTEWLFVVDPTDKSLERLDIPDWPAESEEAIPHARRADLGRKPVSLQAFESLLSEKNDSLRRANQPEIRLEELVGARLYTGPMFEKYNAVLRGGARNTKQLDFMQKIFTDFCKHNRYVTTLHVINSALIKLSKLLSVVKVYRGVERGMLPECFWEANDFNVRGGVEFAFMSTTTERDVAIFYSGAEKDGNVSTIIEGQLGMVDRGADLSSLSQYPHEKEICFGPLTSLEVLSTRVEKSYLVVHCRFNINLVSLTIEQVLAKRHRIVTDVCDNVMQHTRKVIAAFSSNPSEGAETKSAIEYACTKLEGITARRPDIFNDDGELKGAVTKALDMKGLFDEWLQATMCHNVPDIDDRGDPDVTWSSFATKTVEHYHTLIPSDLSHITLSCQWRDEGSGTFHGRINLVVTRNGEIVSEVPCFGRAPHDWQTERAVFSAEELHGHLPGDVLTLQYELGESHYRKLMVKDIELVMDRNPINASRRAVSQQEAARSETFGFREARKGSKEQVLADGMRRNALAERAHLVEELVQSQTGDAQALPALLGLTPSPLEVLAAAGRAGGGNLLHLVCKLRRVDVFKCLLGIADGVWTEMAKERDGEGALPDLPGLARAVAASRPFDARAAGPLLSLLPSSCAGSFFQERDEVGNAPLHAAAVSGRVGDVLALARAHLPQAELRGLFLARNSQGHPPMHCAAEAGRPEAVRGLAEALEPDELAAALAVTAGHRERTPLHLAASNGHAETVRVLAGLAPDLPTALALPDSVGRTALHLAAGSGDAEAVRALAGLAPDLPAALAARSQSGKTPLHAAADWGEVDAILALVQLAPDVPTVLAARTSDGSAPLHLAAKSGRVDAVRALVELAPDLPAALAARTGDGQTPLHLAASSVSAEAVRALAELAPDLPAALSARDSQGMTPLDCVAAAECCGPRDVARRHQLAEELRGLGARPGGEVGAPFGPPSRQGSPTGLPGGPEAAQEDPTEAA